MKHILITTIAAVVLVGCGEAQQSAPAPESKPVEPVAEVAQPTTPPKAVKANKGADPARGIKPEPLTVEAPAISLFAAADRGNIEAVKQHLAAGTDVNAKDEDGWTPLHFAANEGHKEIAELLITKGADVHAKHNDGHTPLYPAAFQDDKEIAELLIAKGADVNAKDGDGWTPLHFAAVGGSKEIAELLIASGAGVNVKSVDGQTALDIATDPENPNNPLETADLLREYGGKTGEELEPSEANTEASLGESPMEVQAEATGFDVSDISIFLAADAGNIGAVKKHLASGEDVNSQDPELATPLHYAASGGHKEVADFLIEKGATVNALGVHGTPLDNAIRQNHNEVADLLRKHGGKTGEELKAEGK